MTTIGSCLTDWECQTTEFKSVSYTELNLLTGTNCCARRSRRRGGRHTDQGTTSMTPASMAVNGADMAMGGADTADMARGGVEGQAAGRTGSPLIWKRSSVNLDRHVLHHRTRINLSCSIYFVV